MGGIRTAAGEVAVVVVVVVVVVAEEEGKSEPGPSHAKNGGGASALYDGFPAIVSGSGGGMGSTSTAGVPRVCVSHTRENGGIACLYALTREKEK